MNVQCFILLEIVVRLYYVVSYTVVLKQIKPLYQPVKVYRYDLRQPKILSDLNVLYPYKPILSQKIYPIRARGVKKKEAKYIKSLSSDKQFQGDGRLFGISQQLVPPHSNQTEEYSDAKGAAEEERLREDVDARPLPVLPQQEKSFASFGQEREKIYKSAGEWATLAPNEDSENTTQSAFTPSQLYLQIRHKNTVIHVPQSEALKDSETLEELINAPRLKELARTTHVQETYSEEGYEDAAYDHAGHIRQAQHGENYDAKDEGKFKIKEAPVILNYDSDLEESKRAPLKNSEGTEPKANSQEESIIKLAPRLTQSRTELRKTGIEYNKDPPTSYKGERILSSKVKFKKSISNNGSESIDSIAPVTFPSFFGEMPLPPDNIFTNDSDSSHKRLPMKISSKYRKEDLNSTKIYPVSPLTNKTSDQFSDFKPFISAPDSQPSPSAKSLKYSRIYSKKTKQLRLEPYKIGNVYTPPPPPEHLQPPVEEPEKLINQRIVLPTIGYINSLTTAHFGKDVSSNVREEPKAELTSALNLTQALNYLRLKNNQRSLEEPEFFNETDLKTFEPKRLKKQRLHYRNFANKAKRDVYLIKERDGLNEQGKYEGNDEEDFPYNEKNSEILEDERKRIEEENSEKENFEAELREEIMAKEKEIIKEAFKEIGNNSPESFLENFSPESDFHYVKPTTPHSVDFKKYPFYHSKTLPENSPLRYASDPMAFPRKSGHGMEFYESRERLIQCPDFHPDFDDLPNSDSTKYSDNQASKNQRLTSLGDKISCLRSKYFDPEPFDNPIFKEREIDYVGKSKNGFKKVIKPQTKIATKHRKPIEAYKKSTTSAPNTKKGTKILLISTERPFKAQQVSESGKSQHKVKQHSLPTKILPFVPISKTPSSFIKPATEITKEFSSHATEPAAKVKPPTRWKTILHPHSTLLEPPKIVLMKNCMHVINKLTVLNGANNLTVECNDATFFQEILNGVAHVRIVPKEKWSAKISSEQPPETSDWVPIIGHEVSNFTKLVNRKTDEITSPKNETTEKPSSDQYVIDELKEDKNVRQGEVVEDIDHYLKMTDSIKMTTESVKKNEKRKREATDLKPKKGNHGAQRPTGTVVFDAIEKLTQGQIVVTNKTNETTKATSPKLFETKRTLGRLSGRDFLTRYHKSKSKPKVADFWKIVTTNKNLQKVEKTTPVNAFRERSTSNFVLVTNATTEKPMSEEEHKTKLGSRGFKTITPTTSIIEKVTKKLQNKVLENELQMGRSLQNSPKIITEVNKELSESSKKRIIVNKKYESANIKENISKTSKKPEVRYKTINRSKNFPKKTEKENSSSDSPTLYYVMDVRTGRGEWITNYEEQRHSGKFRERGKLKGNIQTRRHKKQKKTKY